MKTEARQTAGLGSLETGSRRFTFLAPSPGNIRYPHNRLMFAGKYDTAKLWQ
ncbi:hypothetical protein ACG2F4_05755 [Halalkalibaculum sp. DA3122]|uniref:hypothetical protein n=1 Tax=unclassified Halalkalibaculum TaxID=2964617 RepID=UPI0037550A1C